jgi:Major capsid protein Gp23
MSGIVEKLTEGIVSRDLQKEGAALLNKWSRTGLLEGIENDFTKNSMAVLLENQAKELLRESSTMAGSDVEGFAAVAFPIVRRVFGQLIANEIVSVQPMSLPSGLIFFLDFTFGNKRPAGDSSDVNGLGDSLYGGNVVGKQLTGGVNLGSAAKPQNAEKSFYALNQGYSSPLAVKSTVITTVASGTVGGAWSGGTGPVGTATAYSNLGDALVQYDPDLSGSVVAVGTIAKSALSTLNPTDLITITITGSLWAGRQIRRLTREDPTDSTKYLIVLAATASETGAELKSTLNGFKNFQYAAADTFTNGGVASGGTSIGSVVGAADWLLESDVTTVSGNIGDASTGAIPEIDIRVDSVAVTAVTKKLRAKWSPELGQDLNAYHNLDAEVELTSILSEQIALGIDREVLGDLIKGATASTLYWSRRPGKFLNRTTGAQVSGASFTGNVSMWYETLIETINDVSAQIHRKVRRGGANFLVCSPEVANLLEFTAGFKASVLADETKGGMAGVMKVGNVSKKWDVFVDPYFPRNVILVGRRGNSFLESGYVYAPYVPLQVTPTIFGTEDFAPRKGVMTRYAKKMVRPDMYGLVIVTDLLG